VWGGSDSGRRWPRLDRGAPEDDEEWGRGGASGGLAYVRSHPAGGGEARSIALTERNMMWHGALLLIVFVSHERIPCPQPDFPLPLASREFSRGALILVASRDSA
jgi:hypothetical protein